MRTNIQKLESLLTAIRNETRVIDNHPDPGALTDCWNEIDFILSEMGEQKAPGSAYAKASADKGGYRGPATTEKEWEEWYRKHCWELSNGTLRKITETVAAERERYEDLFDVVNRYEAFHRVRVACVELSSEMDIGNPDLIKGAAHLLIARAIILLQDSDL